MFQKAIGVLIVTLTGLFVGPQEKQKTDPLGPNSAQATPAQTKKEREHEPLAEPAEAIPQAKTPQPAPAKKVVASEPQELRALARAVITTWNGDEVPKLWPAGVPLDLTSIRSVAGDHPQSIRWDIFPEWVDKYSRRLLNGKQVSIATGTKPKTVKVTLYVAKDDTFDMTSIVVSIKPDPLEPGNDDRPTPPTPPEPKPPEPDEPKPPKPPPPMSDLAKQVHAVALRDIPEINAHRSTVHALAESHERIANDISQAVAGVPNYANLKTPQGIIDATVKSNREAVGDERETYVPFFTALNNEVLKPLVDTKLSTAGGHIEVWKDIATGLRAAAP
jgi:hypothetical protein